MFFYSLALLVKPQFIKVTNTSDFVLVGFFNQLTILVNALQTIFSLRSIRLQINSSGF